MSSNPLKQLAGQTAIYGGSSVIGRFLNYLLVPVHTRVFLPDQYGVVTEIYAYTAFLFIILLYGLETAYFRYNEKNKESVFSTALSSVIATSSLFLIAVLLFRQDLATLVRYPDHSEYIVYLSLIVFMDAISAIPLARLRAENKPKRFALVKLTNIGINIFLNLFLLVLCPLIIKNNVPVLSPMISLVHSGEAKVSHIFIANVLASTVQVFMLSQLLKKATLGFDFRLWKRMIIYALPLLVFGLAGNINETLDRILLKYMLPESEALTQVGIYGACYKIAILMTLFIQAYRYAAEPFFFAKARLSGAKDLYQMMMNYFIIAGATIFLATTLYLDILLYFVNESYRTGRDIIPILLMANLFLGIFYNLSIWYKLTNKTRFGAYLAIGGAVITIILNVYLIPKIGYMGSAWATLACYGAMMTSSYFLGKKHYPVNYNLIKAGLYVGTSLGLFLLTEALCIEAAAIKWIIHSSLFIGFISMVFLMEKNNLKKIITT